MSSLALFTDHGKENRDPGATQETNEDFQYIYILATTKQLFQH